MRIVFVGNCQAHSLRFIYDRYIGSRSGHDSAFVDGWNHGALADSNRLVAEADVVVRQLFSRPLGIPLDDPAAGKRLILVPDVRGSFLWPFGNEPRPDNPTPSYKATGPYDPEVGDRFLNRMIRERVAPEEALRRYRKLDIVRETGLARFYELMLDAQRARDTASGMSVADFIDRQLPLERLFRTQGHLDTPLFNHVARQVYEALGASADDVERALTSEASHPFDPYHDAPVHPGVIAHFRLRYLDEASLYYHVQEGRFTFDDYVLRYMRNDWCPELHEACALLDNPDHDRTLDLFDVALAKAPGCGHGYEKKAHLLQRLGRFAEAAEAMEQALRREPGHRYYEIVLHHYRHHAARQKLSV